MATDEWSDRLRPRDRFVAEAVGRSSRLRWDADASMPWTRFVDAVLDERPTCAAHDFDRFATRPPPNVTVDHALDLVLGVRDTAFDPLAYCCFCGKRCNPCSQSCGRCARARALFAN